MMKAYQISTLRWILERVERRRAALLAGAVERDTELRFRLRRNSGMCKQACKDGLRCWGNKGFSMNRRNNGCRAVRALLGWCLELQITARKFAAFRCIEHAAMLSIATAARRQISSTSGR